MRALVSASRLSGAQSWMPENKATLAQIVPHKAQTGPALFSLAFLHDPDQQSSGGKKKKRQRKKTQNTEKGNIGNMHERHKWKGATVKALQ